MTSSLVSLQALAAEVPELHENELPIPHFFYGVIAMCVFLACLGVLWSFRNTARKMSETPQQGKKDH